MNNEIINLSKISKKFTGANKDISVLKNINLKINKGDLVSLTGPSGSGKSTLLHIIALLDRPTSGEVFFKKRLSIIGTISMDYTIVDISTLDTGKIKVGDWVELIGKNINIKEISGKSQTIPYEILINICSRAKKQYIG